MRGGEALARRTRLLLEGPVLPTLLRLAAPNVGEALARVIFIACDAVFVSWMGTDALAGVSLVFPIFLIMQMMSAGGLGAGVSSSVARALGGGRQGDAAALMAHGLMLATLVAALFAAGMLLGGPALFRAMGATGGAFDAAVAYSTLVFGGGLAVWLMNTLANAIRGTGNMIVPATAIVASEVVHLALSPTLILGWGPFPALGVVGAALAVLGCYAAGTAILLAYLASGRAGVRLLPASFRWRNAHAAAVLRVGAPSGLNVIQFQLTTFAITSLTAGFGAAAVAGFGAATRLELLQIPILFAFGSAVIAMVATNAGAGDTVRTRRIAWTGAFVSASIGIAFGLVATLMPDAWMSLFTRDPAVAAAGGRYLATVGLSYPLLALGYGLFFAAQGAGQVVRPFFVGSLRLVLTAVGGWLAVRAWGGGLDSLFATVALASAAFGLGMLAAVMGLFRRPEPVPAAAE